jgi:hypothetical protein
VGRLDEPWCEPPPRLPCARRLRACGRWKWPGILPCWGHRSGSVLSVGWRELPFAPVSSAGHERVTATPAPAPPPAPHPAWHGILPSQAGCFGNHASVITPPTLWRAPSINWVAVNRSRCRAGGYCMLCVLPANRDKTKSRRADSNRLLLLITSETRGVSVPCRELQNPHI